MTDRQITESTIGLAGRLSHLPYGLSKAEDRGWQSTRNFTQISPVFKPLGTYKTWLPATTASSIPYSASSSSKPWNTSRNQQKWLLKACPEARLGNEYIHDQLSLSISPPQINGKALTDSILFTIGELTDTSDPRLITGVPLVAIASGEANGELRLVKPSVEEWQWGNDGSVSLFLPEIKEGDESVIFQDDAAGPIRRLKSVVSSKRYDPTRWLVMQRDSGTRVFQPEYRKTPTTSSYTSGAKPSRIAPNPILYLAKDRTGGNPHSDVTFNPGVRSKLPQLGIIDECGFWSIWDIAHTRGKSSRNSKVSLKGCGHIEKGLMNHPPSRGAGVAQWHRIFWVGHSEDSSESSRAFDFEEDADVLEAHGSFVQLMRSSTLLLCNAKLVRLLDLTNNTFLPDLSFVRKGSRECILDVHENPQDTQYVFILTTSKFFVVRIYSLPGHNWGEVRKEWVIILSVTHLRDSLDQNLKLAVAPGPRSSKQATTLVYIYSGSNSRVDLFCITMLKSDPSRVTYQTEAVVLDGHPRELSNSKLQTMCLHPAAVTLKHSTMPTDLARRLAKQQVRFYQLVTLRTDMCLDSTLCASTFTYPISQLSYPDRQVTQPKDLSRERRKFLKYMAPRFVVPDDVADYGNEEENVEEIHRGAHVLPQWPPLQRPIGLFYEHLTAVISNQAREYDEAPAEEGLGANPIEYIRNAAEQALENGMLPAITLFQVLESLKLYNDRSLTAADWGVELEQFGRDNSAVALLALDRPTSHVTGSVVSPQELYSMLFNMTMNSGSSRKVQSWIQGTRPVVLGQIACEVYLSSIGLVQRQADLNESQQPSSHDLDHMVIDSQPEDQTGSVPRAQSVVSTSSSRGTKTDTVEKEDAAMALLRSYTGTGKFVPEKRTALLDKWAVGADPANYVFDLDRDNEVTPGMQRREKQLARESRKRRRTETLLQMQKEQEESRLPATQPAPDTRSFRQRSQPLGTLWQSQAMMSDPIQATSQPVPGVFARRNERPKKKVKKRKGGF